MDQLGTVEKKWNHKLGRFIWVYNWPACVWTSRLPLTPIQQLYKHKQIMEQLTAILPDDWTGEPEAHTQKTERS